MNARLQQGLDHHRAERYSEAAAAYRDVLKDRPEQPDALHFLGLALWQIEQRPDEALKLMRKAMALVPGQAHMHHNVATVLGSLGDVDEAQNHYREAIRLKPDYCEAYFNLAGIGRLRPDDALIGAMQALYARDDLPAGERQYLCFALAKAMDDVGRHDEAMHFAIEANRLMDVTFDIEAHERMTGEVIREVTGDVLAPADGRGSPDPSPVFIVGMPRSGTTLVETMLSRHSAVFAAGELSMIGNISSQMRHVVSSRALGDASLGGYLRAVPLGHFADAAAGCLDMVRGKHGAGAFTRFTDKMPQNAYQLGLISLMFPKARVIHVRRHPLDTCLSCYFQRFRNGHEYTARFGWLGRYYRATAAIMAHWKRVVPLPVLDMRYEDLVADPEASARRLVDFAGLGWEDACRSPEAAERTVLTASRWQVRQPVYGSSVARWRRHEAWLTPLIEALGGMDRIEAEAQAPPD